MREISETHQEIKRLQSINASNSAPDWLHSEYSDNIWKISFDGLYQKKISFSVPLENQSCLTNSVNQPLLDSLKRIILHCADPHGPGDALLLPKTVNQNILKALHVIDYFLIRKDHFQLSNGLIRLSVFDLKRLVEAFVGSSIVSHSVYDWPNKLRSFLEDRTRDYCCRDAIKEWPHLIASKEEALTSFCDSYEDLTKYRAYLWENDYYLDRRPTKGGYVLKNIKIAKQIYIHTLWGTNSHISPLGLNILPRYGSLCRELEMVPVKNLGQSRRVSGTTKRYVKTLSRIAATGFFGATINKKTVLDECKKTIVQMPQYGRFLTLPPHVIWRALECAIEFILVYGEKIFQAYIILISESIKRPNQTYDRIINDLNFVSPSGSKIKFWKHNSLSTPRVDNADEKNARYSLLRHSPSLYDLLLVLYGAMHIILGGLTARRLAELTALQPSTCLNESGTHLIFRNGKSGNGQYRVTEERPIPTLLARIIENVRNFQRDLIASGHLASETGLLCFPAASGKCFVAETQIAQNIHLDYFCDFFELPADADGRRYYIRSHQLRRFFAMTFFWAGAHQDTETLSWFLGHTDPEHLYHYITESSSGEVLNSLSVKFISERFEVDETLKIQLISLIRERFDNARVRVLTKSEVDHYIERLVVDNAVSVEPEFFEVQGEKRHRMLVNIHPI